MNAERTLPARPESVAAARRFVVQAMPGLPAETLQALGLMVSELATNCVVHADSEFRIRVQRAERAIRVEVIDAGVGSPHVQSPPPTEPHGRGLQIVDALADDWGVLPAHERGGKVVWFTLDVRPVRDRPMTHS